MWAWLLGKMTPRRPDLPPDGLAAALDRMLRDLERADSLSKGHQLERVVKLLVAMAVDLRNRVSALERDMGKRDADRA